MSRNKDIEFLHKITQEPYSVCRRLMKKYNWSLVDACLDDFSLKKIADVAREVIETFTKCLQPAVERVRDIARAIQVIQLNSVDVEKYDDSLCGIMAKIGPSEKTESEVQDADN